MVDQQLIDKLTTKHKLWTYTTNGNVKSINDYIDPNTGKKPGQFNQCAECKQSWPCKTRQLLDIIEKQKQTFATIAAEDSARS